MIKRQEWRAAVMTAVIASGSVYVPAAIAQSQPSNADLADLADLVKQQAEQIERLNARLDSMENKRVNQQSATALERDEAQEGKPPSEAPATGNLPSSNNSMASMRQEIDEMKKDRVKVTWASGAPEFSSGDGEYTFGVGGRIQYDFSSTSGSNLGSNADRNDRDITGTEFRRLRLDVHGQLTDPILYKLEIDFAGSDVGLRDVYIATKKTFELGEGAVYLGSKFADTGLDGRTSSKYTWFSDRNTVSNGIDGVPGAYNIGVSGDFYGNHDNHISVGITKGSADDSNTASDNFLVRSRAHWDPVNTGNTILHVGANGYYQDLKRERQDSFSSNTVIAGHYNGNLRIASPVIDAKSTSAYGFELAGLTGPFAAGAEYGRLNIDARQGRDTHVDAYSGQVGVSLTGEQFGYSTKQGVWTHPDIANPVNKGGIGAWQLMARYQALDSNGNGYQGGSGHGTTVGLSWYLNDYMRVLLDDTLWKTNNRTPADVDPASGYYGPDDGNTVFARAQIIF